MLKWCHNMATKHILTSWLYIQLTIVHRTAVYPTFSEKNYSLENVMFTEAIRLN